MKYVLNAVPRARLLKCTHCSALWADDEFQPVANDMRGYGDYESKCPICGEWNLVPRNEPISITRKQLDELIAKKIYLYPDSYKIIDEYEFQIEEIKE